MLKFSTMGANCICTHAKYLFAIVLLSLSATVAQAKIPTTDQANKQINKQANKQAASRHATSKKPSRPAVLVKRTVKKSIKAKAARTKFTKTKSKKLTAMSRKAIYIPEKSSVGDLEGLQKTRDPLDLKSNVALVIDQESSQVLFEKNADVSLPIASITKLMTSLIVLEANQDMDEILEALNMNLN